jgi:M6 family metalloprotease-like protein
MLNHRILFLRPFPKVVGLTLFFASLTTLYLAVLLLPAFAGTPKVTPWAVLRCYASDTPVPIVPPPSSYVGNPEQYFADLFTSAGAGKGGMHDYWRQVSNGDVSLDGTEVFPWVSMDQPYSVVSQLGFAKAAQPCLDKALAKKAGNLAQGVGYLSKFYGLFVIMNVNGGEQGSSLVTLTANGNTWRTLPLVVFSLDVLNPSNAAHEMGHGYGLDHGYDSKGNTNCGGLISDPGVYCDFWDAMGAPFNGRTLFSNSRFSGPCGSACAGQDLGNSGPGLNAPHLSYLGWISGAQTFVYDYSQPMSVTITLAALGFSQSGLPSQIGVPPPNPIDTLDPGLNSTLQGYTVEFRRSTGWDRGFADSVIIHTGWSPNGAARTYIVDNNGGPLWSVGQKFVDNFNNLQIAIDGFDAQHNTATVTLSRLRALRTAPLKTTAVAVVSWGTNRLDIFGLGTDNQMFHKAWDGTAWRPSVAGWDALGSTFNSPPAVVSWGANRLDIFGLGTDNQMLHKAWDGNAWHPSVTGWDALGGTFNSPPAVVSWGANRLDIFGLGTDNQMFHKAWDGSAWRPSVTGWDALGGTFNSPPAVVSWGANRLASSASALTIRCSTRPGTATRGIPR